MKNRANCISFVYLNVIKIVIFYSFFWYFRAIWILKLRGRWRQKAFLSYEWGWRRWNLTTGWRSWICCCNQQKNWKAFCMLRSEIKVRMWYRYTSSIDFHKFSWLIQHFPVIIFNLMNSFIISLQFFKKTRKVGFQIENNENWGVCKRWQNNCCYKATSWSWRARLQSGTKRVK